MPFSRQVSLAPYTTFRIGGNANYFVEVTKKEEIPDVFIQAQQLNLPILLLGGGSNILVSDQGFTGVVLFLHMQGRKILSEDIHKVCINVAAGESWDDFVAYCVNQGWWGIENLSHIPGKVGGIAIQNVGAYGQEGSQVIESVEVFDTQTKAFKTLRKEECGFGYRVSIFNSTQRGRYIILSITFCLQKKGIPQLQYPDLQTYFAENKTPALAEIRTAIITIRDKKFPRPFERGSAGSFFKNVILNASEYNALEKNITQHFSPEVVKKLQAIRHKFPQSTGIKIPTAFLIDICDLKGMQIGGAQVNPTQPMVIVNQTDTATAFDVLSLMQLIRKTVYQKTGVIITPEPEFIGFKKQELETFFSL